VTLINGVAGFVILGSICWFHYRDGSSSLDEKAHAPIPAGESVTFASDRPELCVEMVIVVANVALEKKPQQCMRGHDFQQAWPGRCLHQCTFAVKPGSDVEVADAPQFVQEKLEPSIESARG
jgi:hypothetical protein